MPVNNLKYSLWLRPTLTQIDEYGLIISQLAHKYDSVPFQPHITLLSGLSGNLKRLKNSCAKIVSSTKKFDITCNNISYTNEFFRNFFILVNLRDELDKLYETTLQEFAYTPEDDYMPHVSLYYGKLNIDTKKKLVAELEHKYPHVFKLERLDLFETSGNIAEWNLLESYYFK